jgi:predicted transcriptional regulator
MAKTTVITLRVDTELQQILQAMAQKEEIPASYVIRRLIKAGLKAEGKMPAVVKTTTLTTEDWE